MISDRQLRKTLDDLRELERKCFAARNRFAFYDYLAAVFELYVQLRRRNQAKPSARRIAKLFRLRKQNRTHPIRVIIDATSTADIKSRSRWTWALRYAWRERKIWRTLHRSCGKTVGLLVAPISLRGPEKRISGISSTGMLELVGRISLSIKRVSGNEGGYCEPLHVPRTADVRHTVGGGKREQQHASSNAIILLFCCGILGLFNPGY